MGVTKEQCKLLEKLWDESYTYEEGINNLFEEFEKMRPAATLTEAERNNVEHARRCAGEASIDSALLKIIDRLAPKPADPLQAVLAEMRRVKGDFGPHVLANWADKIQEVLDASKKP